MEIICLIRNTKSVRYCEKKKTRAFIQIEAFALKQQIIDFCSNTDLRELQSIYSSNRKHHLSIGEERKRFENAL